MPKLPQGMFRRKGRSGWYMRLYRAGGERCPSEECGANVL